MIQKLIRESRVIVCCGAGGVGKTTTSGAIAVAAARMGRRVLALTIDPSKRLAETLGVASNPPTPVTLDRQRLERAGIVAPGSLDAWMLDPKKVADDAVRRLVVDPREVEKLMNNKIYQHVTTMVAGMHEYTAMHALHRFVLEGRYDLVVLDTPPSRHALDFLEAPGRLTRFLDGRIFRMFLPSEIGSRLGGITRAASGLVTRVLNGILGEQFAGDLTVFFSVFANVLGAVTKDVAAMREFLGGPEVSFLLVTSPSPASLEEARFFQRKTEELHLPFRGFILNRSNALSEQKVMPKDSGVNISGGGPELEAALEKLANLAEAERELIRMDQELLKDLETRAGPGRFALALPVLAPSSDEMQNLVALAGRVAASS